MKRLSSRFDRNTNENNRLQIRVEMRKFSLTQGRKKTTRPCTATQTELCIYFKAQSPISSMLGHVLGSGIRMQPNTIHLEILTREMSPLQRSPQILSQLATRSAGIDITGPVHIVKSQNELYSVIFVCRYLMNVLGQTQYDLEL